MRSLLKCENVIHYFARTNRIFKAVEQFLPQIREAVKILEEPFVVTKTLQQPKCTLSDFFGALIIMKEKLSLWTRASSKKTNLAESLITQYGVRKNHLLNNEAMISAVYLDRRFSMKQDKDEVRLAKLSLCRLWERIRQKVLNGPERADMIQNIDIEAQEECLINFNNFDIEQFLSTPSRNTVNVSTPNIVRNEEHVQIPRKIDFSKTKDEFMICLSEFEIKYATINHKTQILEFMEMIKCEFPEIHAVATI